MKGARPLTRHQVKAVLQATDSVREKALLSLEFCTGYRISELLSLTVADVSTGETIHSHITVKASNTKTPSDTKASIAPSLTCPLTMTTSTTPSCA